MSRKKFQKSKVKPKIKEEAKPKGPQAQVPQLLRGFKDILPPEAPYWRLVFDKAEAFAQVYNFLKIDPPILEEASLFKRAVGKQTDIIEKEMFEFVDKSGEAVALRPEATASIARAYINYGMFNLPQPVKLYYWGPMFRYERPQTGRLRQFHQFGFEVIGDNHPVLDARLIFIAYNFCKELGLEVSLQINSIGCPACRQNYKNELVNYYRRLRSRLCENCKRRLVRNPLRLLDCKEEKCKGLREGAPQIIDWLDEGCKNHFMKVLEFLDEQEVPYNLNPFLVRGLDYYTKTVFEIWPLRDEPDGSQSALIGGGRYDNLVELLGGRPAPALGFAAGIERIIAVLHQLGVIPPLAFQSEIFLAQLGQTARKNALDLFETLRKEGFKVAEAFSRDGLRPQLEIANKLGVKITLILGQKELLDKTIIMRDMEAGIQEIIDQKKLIDVLKKKLDQAAKIAETPREEVPALTDEEI